MVNAEGAGEITMLGFEKFSIVSMLYFDFLHVGCGEASHGAFDVEHGE